jgi:hypothetical protein
MSRRDSTPVAASLVRGRARARRVRIRRLYSQEESPHQPPPHSMPAVVRIVWPAAATITTPAHYLEVASAAMRLLAEASHDLSPHPSEPTALTDLDCRLQAPGQPAGTITSVTWSLSRQETLALPINAWSARYARRPCWWSPE